MPPQALQLAFFIIEEGIKLEPAIAAEIKALLAKDDPTPADWDALRATVAAKSYEDYVPATALVDGAAPAAAPAPAPQAPAAIPADVFTGQAKDPHA